MANKIIGYVLLAAGLLLIIFPLFQTYKIFTGKTMPPQIFKEVSLRISPTVDLANSSLNLSAWFVLLAVLIYGGGKIADIGVKLLNGKQ